jgi:hypothetical protein
MKIVKGGLIRSEGDRQRCGCHCYPGRYADANIEGLESGGCGCWCFPATAIDLHWWGLIEA